MHQIQKVLNCDDNAGQQGEQNRFENCEQIVDVLVEKGLPNIFNPSTYISKISKAFGISSQEARTCLKLAVKQLESASINSNNTNENLYGNSGYFYPKAESMSYNDPAKHDEYDSLNSLGSYNRLMFGIR